MNQELLKYLNKNLDKSRENFQKASQGQIFEDNKNKDYWRGYIHALADLSYNFKMKDLEKEDKIMFCNTCGSKNYYIGIRGESCLSEHIKAPCVKCKKVTYHTTEEQRNKNLGGEIKND